MFRKLMATLVLALCAMTAFALPKPSEVKAAFAAGDYAKAESMLNEVMKEKLDVQSLAASLHMSYGHLARSYKQLTGTTIISRLNEIRLEKAALLLADTDHSVKEIAALTGFANQHYFNRIFREKFGCTPLEYRHQVIKVQ